MRLVYLTGKTFGFVEVTVTSSITVPIDADVVTGITAVPLPAVPSQTPIVPNTLLTVTVTLNKDVVALLVGKSVCIILAFESNDAQFATCVKFVFMRLKIAISVAP